MMSFTKDTINTHTSKWRPKLKKSEYYIYRMKIKNFDFLWFGWLVLVCIWNFVWPEVPPIADVLVAVILSLGVITIKNRKK